MSKNYRYKTLIDKLWLGAYLVIHDRPKYKRIELHYAFN